VSGFKVALIGHSGAGKTSAASIISSGTKNIHWVETSRDLIERREYQDTGNFLDDRQHGFNYFSRMSNSEGADWAASRLEENYGHLTNILVTGVRGTANIKALKQNGYFCVFLTADQHIVEKRLAARERIEQGDAASFLRRESRFFQLDQAERLCDFVLDTTSMTMNAVESAIVNICISASKKARVHIGTRICPNCVNSMRNSGVFSRGKEVCDVCDDYNRSSVSTDQIGLLESVFDECRRDLNRPVALGYSGGKDSHAAALILREKVNAVRLFTVDTGYYPITMLERAKRGAGELGLAHDFVDASLQITPHIHASFERTASLFESLERSPSSGESREFYRTYFESRRHYSVKDDTPTAFPRVCVLCRKSVIRSYYDYAQSIGAKYVFLGMNEWAELSKSANPDGSVRHYSGFRKIDPNGDGTEIVIVHLPFVMGASLAKNSDALAKSSWRMPYGERLVETNANSCLLAKVTEALFFEKLGFHPDSTRLGREVTVGFLRRGEALEALSRLSCVPWGAREILRYAGILP